MAQRSYGVDNQRLAIEREQGLWLPHTRAFAACEDYRRAWILKRHKKSQKAKGKNIKAKIQKLKYKVLVFIFDFCLLIFDLPLIGNIRFPDIASE
jgi:hypothetical protein